MRRWMILCEAEGINRRSATGQFLKEMDRFRVDQYNPMIGVGRNYELDSIDVHFNLRPLNDSETVLQSLAVVNPASGEGTKAMEIICTFADRCKVILLLDAAPYESNHATPMPKAKLVQWYTRFGFVAEDGTTMRRVPK